MRKEMEKKTTENKRSKSWNKTSICKKNITPNSSHSIINVLNKNFLLDFLYEYASMDGFKCFLIQFKGKKNAVTHEVKKP